MSRTLEDPEVFSIKGFKLSRDFLEDLVRSALDYKPNSNDVFVVSYPKCGAAFVQHVVYLIFRRGNPSDDYVEWSLSTPYLELVGAEKVKAMIRPGAIKSHFPVKLMPWSNEAKYIYVARNPKDCFVSIFFNRQLYLKPGSLDVAFEEFISGEMVGGDYFDHLLDWHSRKDNPKVLFLLYEDIKRSPHEVITQIAWFLGEEYGRMLEENESLLDKIVHHSSYDFMKEHANRAVRKFVEAPKEEVVKSSDAEDFLETMEMPVRTTRTFARRGTVGDWKSHLSFEQEKQLEALLKQKAKGTSLTKLWSDLEEDDDDF